MTSYTSNLDTVVESAVTYSLKLATEWTSSPVKVKENIQKLVFPEGVTYNVKTGEFRTEKVNLVFQLNADLNSVSEDDIKKQGGKKATLSCLVGKTLQNSNQFLKDLEAIAAFLKRFHATELFDLCRHCQL